MSLRTRSSVAGLTLAALLLASCTAAPPPLPRGDGVSLVLLVVIDQARQEYLERFRPLLQGGLGRLLERGAVFTDAHHEHSATETAPGHATISTGMEPARSGVVGNYWFDPVLKKRVYSAYDGDSPSPTYLEVTTLGDWLKAADSRSRVFAASPKDRSAVMLGGHNPDAAYWYDDDDGAWRSSEYYADAERPWLQEFHGSNRVDRFFGAAWEPLTDPALYDSFEVGDLDRGVFARGFPHALGGRSMQPDSGYYAGIYDSPFIDEYLADFARALVDNEELGQDGSVDLLALSFSALDAVGHDYGPNSPELLDAIVRLDRTLGELLDFIDERVGSQHVLVALSADHGVVPLPEFQSARGLPGRRLGAGDAVCMQQAGLRLREALGEGDWFLGGFHLDHALIQERGLELSAVEALAAQLAAACEAVERVWTASELAAEAVPDDPLARRVHNNYFPGRSPDLMLQVRPYYLSTQGTGTSHGSVYDYDAQVPLIFAGPGVAPGQHTARVATADVAPTLAALLGIEAPEGLDGVDRSAAVATRSAR